ncbi:MAG: 7-carboxy-7-deazaguanine synthase QueE [Gammaproteobacteria bacterium]|jgi:7-carboxy-7-deazaguanine synthase|nr:7-carboxy-7-deazaguanine synthase QueE [Gammaproteobacteria bacterium]
MELRITEIFHSLQGEARSVGLPTVFVRLTGCPLRCHYCDTAYAFSGGELMSLARIIERVNEFGCTRVCVTGGEPLAQPECLALLDRLCEQGFEVSLETSGAMSIAGVNERVSRVVDIKTPDSGEVHRNDWSNIARLTPHDQIKFVVCSRLDYDWARMKMDELQLAQRVSDVLFSPSYEQVEPLTLANWILEDRLPARLQIQLHKLLWHDAPGH